METFKERLLETLKKLLTSGKVLTAIVGLIVGFAAKRGIVLQPEDVNTVLLIFSVLVGAQGLHDFGKGAAIIKAESPAAPEQTQTVNVEAQNPAPVVSQSPSRFS